MTTELLTVESDEWAVNTGLLEAVALALAKDLHDLPVVVSTNDGNGRLIYRRTGVTRWSAKVRPPITESIVSIASIVAPTGAGRRRGSITMSLKQAETGALVELQFSTDIGDIRSHAADISHLIQQWYRQQRDTPAESTESLLRRQVEEVIRRCSLEILENDRLRSTIQNLVDERNRLFAANKDLADAVVFMRAHIDSLEGLVVSLNAQLRAPRLSPAAVAPTIRAAKAELGFFSTVAATLIGGIGLLAIEHAHWPDESDRTCVLEASRNAEAVIQICDSVIINLDDLDQPPPIR